MRRAALILLLGTACAEEEPPAPAEESPRYQPMVRTRQETLAEYGLPDLDAAALLEYRELLEAVPLGGRIGNRAVEELWRRDPRELAAAMLAVVEDRDSWDELRREAYSLLRERPVPAMAPRLILRLKYETNWPANVDIAAALLTQGNGAGLEALVNILNTVSEEPVIVGARTAAAQALSLLPPLEGWKPGEDFAHDWDRLLEVQEVWLSEGRLGAGGPADGPLPAQVQAEVWRMIARFTSQPLRPVDDARFVLVRMDGRIVPELCEALDDESHYVREHALQTLGWMGYSAGHWVQRHGFRYFSYLDRALEDPKQRTRALEALGASGLVEAASRVLAWAQDGNGEERTAAADALLRCAGPGEATQVAALLASDYPWSPEARYSLSLLAADLSAAQPPAAPADLDPSEKDRREIWLNERSLRPKAED